MNEALPSTDIAEDPAPAGPNGRPGSETAGAPVESAPMLPAARPMTLSTALRRLSLFHTLAMFVFAMLIGLFAAILLYREIVYNQQAEVDRIALQVNTYLQDRSRLMASLAASVARAGPQASRALLSDSKLIIPGFEALYALDGRGTVILADHSRLYPLEVGLDLSGERFFRQAAQATSTVFSPPFVSLTTGQVVTTAANPYYWGATLQTVVVGELNLAHLQTVVEASRPQAFAAIANGSSFIVDSRGSLVAHPNPAWVQERRSLAHLPLVAAGLNGRSQVKVFFDAELGGWYIGSVRPLESGWVAVSIAPLAQAARPMGALFAASTLSLLISALLIIASEQRSLRRLAAPVIRLAERADMLSRGENPLAAEAGPPSSAQAAALLRPIVEIRRLEDAFDHMAAAVHERTASLETGLARLSAAQSALRDSEARYRGLFEASLDAVMLITPNEVILDANPAAERLTGYTRLELIGMHINRLRYPGEAMPSPQRQELWRRGGAYEVPLRTRDDRRVIVEMMISPLYDDAGEVLLFVAIHHDLTDRRRAQAELLRQREDFLTILNLSPEMIWYLDREGRILRCNKAAARVVGLPIDRLIGKMAEDLYPPETAAAFTIDTLEVLQSGMPKLGIIESVVIDGALHWIETDKLPYLDAGGNTVGVVVFSSDITERMQAEEELRRYRENLEDLVEGRTAELNRRVIEVEQLNETLARLLRDLRAAQETTQDTLRRLREANEQQEAFVYTVSHDLRSPLRHIQAYSQLLVEAEAGRLAPDSARFLEAITASVERMSRLIDDLLAFSRTGRAPLETRRVDVNALIRAALPEILAANRADVHDDALGSAGEPGPEIEWRIAELPAVMADPSLLNQVIVNLLSNAVKFSRDRRPARIEVGWFSAAGAAAAGGEDPAAPEDASLPQAANRPEIPPGWIALCVRDNGVGFDPQFTDKLFGVFQRLHRVDEFEGTGIGLATVRRVIQRHGGQVWAEGALGRGAAFYITLKLAED